MAVSMVVMLAALLVVAMAVMLRPGLAVDWTGWMDNGTVAMRAKLTVVYSVVMSARGLRSGLLQRT